MSISALIIAQNEEKKIEQTLKSLGFVDEIIIILDRSTDNTKIKSKKYTNKIYEGSWKCEGKRRNYGLSKCKSEWILEIDADEVVSNPLADEIEDKIKDSNVDFFYIPLINYVGKLKICNGWMSCMAPDGKFCLFKRNCKSWSDGSVHPNYNLTGNKGVKFSNSLDHFMSKDISDLLIRFNRNTSLYAQDLKMKRKDLTKLFSKRKIFSRFFKSYFSRTGFKSGEIGILIAALCSIYPYVSAIKSKQN